MMPLSRRRIIAGGMLAVLAGLSIPLATRRIEDELRAILDANFGPAIADAPESALFIADVADVWNGLNTPLQRITRPTLWMLGPLLPIARRQRDALGENVVNLFLRATNVVRAHETGDDLQYVGIPDPYQNPCANPLSFAWL
ncbi:MAG: hypothetical protein LJE68_16715 [Rhodobacter sp.]|jgi:hypothetical protein|nr:hypothetical protein [Rhodobacter sp.]